MRKLDILAVSALLIFLASAITVAVIVFASKPEEKAQEKKSEEKSGAQSKQGEQSKFRVDPLGKFTAPGRCIGWTCF